MINPETNQLEKVFKDPDGGGYRRADGEPVSSDYPVFTMGEMFVLKNYAFQIVRIETGSLTLSPLGPVVPPKKKVARSINQKKRDRKRRR